jgi:glyoxylase-like metal-dependent hydrolase (beta-lactamase superfamily II)
MKLEAVTEHIYRTQVEDLSLYFIVLPEGVTLVDAGFPGTVPLIEEALHELGLDPCDITDILVTHAHPDHAGGLAEVQRACGTTGGATVWMHPDDAAMVRKGEAFRPYAPAPGVHNRTFVEEVISQAPTTYEPASVDREVLPGEEIPVAGGITALGTPGHTAGHLAFLWQGDGGVLFVGDAAKNEDGLAPATIYEDFAQGLEDLAMLAGLNFEVACFAHGAPIVGGASDEFRRLW